MQYDTRNNPEFYPSVTPEVREIVEGRLQEIDKSIEATGTVPEVISGQADQLATDSTRAYFNQASTDETVTVGTEAREATNNVVSLSSFNAKKAATPPRSDQLDAAHIRQVIEEINNASKAA